ncbi:hypothetical protein DSM104299_01163 [Baekduia alba]|uniref:hypothetical protein n=1 Tax=Baekduia alba TaxID=2997333 RepID=UPI00234214BC|nr:hypothetical protein [Baekduia alba]WCB92467.1 hypothetical protein DSM104299_01163 [Baekduia alba]
MGLAILGPAVLKAGGRDLSVEMLVAILSGIAIVGATWLATKITLTALGGLEPSALERLELEED